MRLVLASAVLLGGCGFQGDMLVKVAYDRPAEGADCVALTALDVSTVKDETVRSETTTASLSGKAAKGTLKFGLQQPSGWLSCVRLSAELRAGGCDGGVVAKAASQQSCFERNVSTSLDMSLVWTADSGVSDGGIDGGTEDGGDSTDAGAFDGGLVDGGVDAGTMDAGPTDAGVDAGPTLDAGYNLDGGPLCMGQLRVLLQGGSEFWKDVALYDPSNRSIVAVGDNSEFALITSAGSNKVDWPGPSCTGDFRAVWVSPASRIIYAATTLKLYAARWPSGCDTLASYPTAGVSSIAGVDLPDGGVRLLVGSTTSPYIFAPLPDAGIQAETIFVPGPVNDLVMLDSNTGWAVGSETNHESIWRFNSTTARWDSFATGNPGAFYGVAIASPSQAFTAGWHSAAVDVFGWDGAAWTTKSTAPDFKPAGVAMRERNNVTVVGQKRSGGAIGFARWDGATWTYPTGGANPEVLRRVRTAGGCDVWAVGDNGYIVTMLP